MLLGVPSPGPRGCARPAPVGHSCQGMRFQIRGTGQGLDCQVVASGLNEDRCRDPFVCDGLWALLSCNFRARFAADWGSVRGCAGFDASGEVWVFNPEGSDHGIYLWHADRHDEYHKGAVESEWQPQPLCGGARCRCRLLSQGSLLRIFLFVMSPPLRLRCGLLQRLLSLAGGFRLEWRGECEGFK